MRTCVICKTGLTRPGAKTMTFTRGEATVFVKDVPGDVCENCGEGYFSKEVTAQVIAQVDEAINRGAEVEVRRYKAAA